MDPIIIIIFASTIVACTVTATLCLQQAWRLFSERHLVPRMTIPRDWLAPVLKRTRIARMSGDIYIGYCAATGQKVSGQLAHAHVGGSHAICIFQLPDTTRMEWLLAHEYGHLYAAQRGCKDHDGAWKSVMRTMGYGEEADRYTEESHRSLPDRTYTSRNHEFAYLAAVALRCAEAERPSARQWLCQWFAHLASALRTHTQRLKI